MDSHTCVCTLRAGSAPPLFPNGQQLFTSIKAIGFPDCFLNTWSGTCVAVRGLVKNRCGNGKEGGLNKVGGQRKRNKHRHWPHLVKELQEFGCFIFFTLCCICVLSSVITWILWKPSHVSYSTDLSSCCKTHCATASLIRQSLILFLYPIFIVAFFSFYYYCFEM